KVCLTFIFSCFFIRFAHAQIRTYDTTFDGWNAIVTEDLSLKGMDSAAGIIFFPGIDQQDKNINDLKVNGPHYLIENGMWDGSVTLGNGVHHPFIISLQPSAPGYPATVVKPKIDEILARYRIRRNSLFFTGLSMGAWQANEFITYEATPGDHTYGRMVRAMVNLEGVEPSDYTGIYSSLEYPGKMGDWARACGGRELWVEGSQDWRDMLAGAQNMNSAVAGSATYFQVTYGGGAHCCWNTEYEPGVTWTKASNKNIAQLVGTSVPMNVWQWLLRQGDTSMPGGAPAPPPPPAAPNVSAGADPTITLPVTTTTLSGTASGANGARITAVLWKQTQGPAAAKIVSPSNLSTPVNGLATAGTYVFQLTVTDQNGKQAASTADVVVQPAPAVNNSNTGKTPPTVSAGANQTVTLPTSTATLKGSAVGHNGAVVNSYYWMFVSGPAYVKFSNEWALSTTVSELVAGTYVFELSASDNKGETSTSTVTVTVEKGTAGSPAVSKPSSPAPPGNETSNSKTPPTVNAGKGQKITLPASSTTLAGTATGANGAKIVTISWAQVGGPEKAKIATPADLKTEVTGMTEPGDYIFQLIAIDNDGKSANGSMTVTVEPAAEKVAPTVSAGPNLTVTLPASTATLKGSASGHNGAVVNSYYWMFISGPAWVKFSDEWAATTTVSSLEAGTYVFELSASDNRGETSTSAMTLVVKPRTSGASGGATAETSDVAAVTDPAVLDSIDRFGGLVIYPNPVNDLLNLQLANTLTGKLLVRVFDANGKLVQMSMLEKEGTSVESAVDVSKLARGVYILQLVTQSGGTVSRSFVKL
ncbi:MAG TPA: T9SS type A sorting domain-containing protein, partial [Puia sp.]|nr:T9SS type A sorting domain-containing protein [Puia sp.]